MLPPFHPCACPDDRGAAGGPSPTIQHQASHHELTAARRQREIEAYCAAIATSRQLCRDAQDLLATATEGITCSRHVLAADREILDRGA